MKQNKSKSERKQTRKPHVTKPQGNALINVQPDSTERHSKGRIALRRFTQRLTQSRRGVVILISVALALLGYALNIDDAISRWRSHKRPAAEIMYFQKRGSDYSLIEPGNVVLEPSLSELKKNYVPIPINLAVRNREKGRLEATRVEITYPKGLRITPRGRPKIDPQNNTLIYEHNLRSLDPVASFTPLDTIDVIYMEHSIKGLKSTPYSSG